MKRFLISITLFFCISMAIAGEILHYTETSAFNHNTAQESRAMVQAIAAQLGHTVVHDPDGSQFDSQINLARFKVVIFSNTSGNNILNAPQRANFEFYIANGGSYIGIHAASDTYRHSTANGNRRGTWDWYAETVCGASVQQNPNHTANNFNADMTFIIPGSAIGQNLPVTWNKNEEYYYWENGYLNQTDFTTILEVEQTGNNSYDAARMTAHFRDLPGGGRAFYTSLGHNRSDYTDPNNNFRLFIKNAISWACTGQLPIEFLPEEELLKINPRLINPSRDGSITFLGEIDKERELTMRVVNTANQVIFKERRLHPTTGEIVWREELDLPSGIYVVQVYSLGKYIKLGMVVVKQ